MALERCDAIACGPVLDGLLAVVHEHYMPNVRVLFVAARLLVQPRVQLYWERKAGAAVPVAALRELVTIIPDR